LGSRQNVFGTADASFYNGLWLEFFSDDTVRLGDIGASTLDLELRTSQVFRDPSSWGHLIITVDTTQSTASNRIKLYWNGIQITAFSTSTYPTQNFDTRLNTASAHGIGRAGSYNAQYFNGYLADIHFIDGQALDPTSFGEFSATTGVWMPKAYTGSYGTNGFRLTFADNSAATATTLGKDAAGSNNWTPNNFSVAGGSNNIALPSSNAPSSIEYLVVGGGGGGGNYFGGGGGGGGVLTGTASVSASASFNVRVGVGGTQGSSSQGNNGEDSWISSIATAVGGGGGGGANGSASNGRNGGSGGGGGGSVAGGVGGSGTAGQGTSGGNRGSSGAPGGGGGAGQAGGTSSTTTGGKGGDGVASSITGTSTYYGGGGGGSNSAGSSGAGGLGGGGTGSVSAGTPNTGGGAGGDTGPGGSGIVVIRYSNTFADLASIGSGLTYTYANTGGYKIYTFTASISASVAAGNDSLVDVPVNGSETDTGAGGQVRGNYCTWNPLEKAANATLSNGNLDITQASGDQNTGGTIAVSSGKWYWEVTFASGTESRIGAIKQQFVKTDSPFATFLGGGANGYSYANGGYKSNNNNNSATGYSTYTTNDVISVALDLDNGRIFFAKNGTWQESGNPATGSNPAYTGLSGAFTPAVYTPNATLNANFGQRPFAYTAPSGFKALNTANLPSPLVTKPSEVMGVKLYSGTGSSQSVSGVGFSPDWVWIKRRDAARSHMIFDIVRGLPGRLASNETSAENTDANNLTSFDSDGFTTSTGDAVNGSGGSYVAWCWDASSSTVTNTAGSISSQVRANASAGFSVVTYTGAGSTSSTVGHGLGVAPSFIIAKARTTASQVNSWRCYHRSLGATQYIELSSTAAAGTFTDWANTAPTSSAFYVGGTNTTFPVNENGISYVAYCFAPVAGYSAFGSYTGNGSASDGPFVYTGFRPRWILLKDSTNAGSWELIDTARIGYNGANYRLFPNLSDAEFADHRVDILSNGFKLRVGAGSAINSSNAVIVYAAFSEVAFNFARAR
jgi:hypothetical protein